MSTTRGISYVRHKGQVWRFEDDKEPPVWTERRIEGERVKASSHARYNYIPGENVAVASYDSETP